MTATPHTHSSKAAQRARRLITWSELMSFLLCFAPAALLVIALLFLPIGWLAWLSFLDDAGRPTLGHYARLLGNETLYRTLYTTFVISGIVTALCVLFGYPLAYALAEMPQRLGAILLIGVILPYWTSILVRTYAWLVLLQRRGLVNNSLLWLGLIDEPMRLAHNFLGTVIGMTHIMLPFFILPVYASMRSIDRLYITAAASLGASPTRAFWAVFVPLSAHGVSAGAFLVFVLSVGFYVTPAILGGGQVIMIAQQIESNVALYNNWGAASALGMILLLVITPILLMASRLSRSGLVKV
jgi:ABC-type spermidine/putrescine transport system permease subunit I